MVSFFPLSGNARMFYYRNVTISWSFSSVPDAIGDITMYMVYAAYYLSTSEYLISKHLWPHAFQIAILKVRFLASSSEGPEQCTDTQYVLQGT